MNDTSKVLIATISGAALGLAAGLLVAPKSGKETRDDINDRVLPVWEVSFFSITS